LRGARGGTTTLSICESCYDTVYLPIASSLEPPRLASDPRPTVLVVDDDLAIRTTLSFVLSEEGFRVDLAANGKEALHKVRQAPPDAIVLDVRMPVMDGPSFLAELRRTMPESSIPVLLTSTAERLTVADTLKVEALLPKPFSVDDLLDSIHGLLRRTA
jgi:two-component system response regulator MprA